jgi:hypothetical protein
MPHPASQPAILLSKIPVYVSWSSELEIHSESEGGCLDDSCHGRRKSKGDIWKSSGDEARERRGLGKALGLAFLFFF